MPELPEVETIRRGLEKHVVGYTIIAIDVRLAKQFHGQKSDVLGATITGVRRYGKGLLIDLSNDYSLAVHVKMTGQLIFRSTSETLAEGSIGELPNTWTHVIFALTRDSQSATLYYNDQRQFGWIKVVKTSEVAQLQFFKSLGKEPLKDLSLQDFTQLLSRTKTPIKLLIMDQSKMAGIGNIYANDALYRAKIHPKRPANSLSTAEIKTLFEAIEAVLRKGIEVGGASESHYVDVVGGKGQYQHFFLVYGKDGDVCARCGDVIERLVLGGRGTFVCPTCQIAP